MNEQQTIDIINELKQLCQHQEAVALEYHVRLLRIALTAERELKRIELDGGMTRFPEEIIKLAEGNA